MTDADTGHPRSLRLLLVEDTDDDAALVARALRLAGFLPAIRRVETAAEFTAALGDEKWDLVISDHSLPRFSSTAALTCLHETGLDLPFIVVSGSIDEESAVSILKAGAHDFVTKQSLARLGPAIRRELQEFRNRSERRMAQHDLQVQRDFLRLVLDTNPNVIFVRNWDGAFTLANRAAADLYGTTVEGLIGRNLRDLGRGGQDALEADREVMRTAVPRAAAAEPVRDARTGEIRWFETRRVPLALRDALPQVLWIGTDITDRRTAEEALRVTEEQFRQAQKMEAVGQLAGGIAHDFNNLLTAILGYSDMLLDAVCDNPTAAADLEEVRKAGRRASSLTSQLLAFSRKQVLQPQVLDLNVLVTEVERMLRRVIGEHIQLDTDLTPSLQMVNADPGQIHQMLMNLAINARDAMPKGGRLRLETANVPAPPELAGREGAPPTCVALSVADTGCGMTAEVRGRIFEPFFTTKDPGKGTGLGLSMVYGMVTQSGGHIRVESEPDRGTRFTVFLPAAAAAGPAVAAAPRAAGSLHGTETVLVVEDEQTIRGLVRKILVRYGYEVLQADDVEDAIAIARQHPSRIHLLLSDVVMPRMSGTDLARRLVPLRPEMRVLYMSGFSETLASDADAAGGEAAILQKPFTPERLARAVRECLQP